MEHLESFEDIVRACKATGDYMPAWEMFVNADFFVAVLPQDVGNQTSDFLFVILKSQNEEPAVIVSENLERLKLSETDTAIKMRGANLISTLDHQVGILVGLSEGAFGIPVKLVSWLRASIQPAS